MKVKLIALTTAILLSGCAVYPNGQQYSYSTYSATPGSTVVYSNTTNSVNDGYSYNQSQPTIIYRNEPTYRYYQPSYDPIVPLLTFGLGYGIGRNNGYHGGYRGNYNNHYNHNNHYWRNRR